jgi:DNA-binding XRE family transcriptional regulator
MSNFRSLRRLKNITQYQLWRKTGIPQSSISLIEREFIKPNKAIKKKISRALGCTVEEVFPSQDEG